jgi:biotin carboxylase
VVDVETYREPGTEITVSGDFRDRIGHVLARGATAAEAAAAAEEGVGRIIPALVTGREGVPA